MKINQALWTSAALGLLLSAPLHAAYFQGVSQDITDFENGSEVSTAGTLIDAVNLLNHTIDDIGVPTTINGVLFKGTYPGAYHEGAESFEDASFTYHLGEGYSDANLWTSGGAYDTMGDSQIFNVDDGFSDYGDGFGVVNLEPAAIYELQVIMLDDRGSQNKSFPLQFQQVRFQGFIDWYDHLDPAPPSLGYMEGITIGGNGITQPNGEIATIRFSIDQQYNGLFVNTWSGGAFNGMQLRLINPVGDYDRDGSVGPEDYLIWKGSYGSTTELAADGNADGIVDAADYTVWRNRLEVVGGGGLGAYTVPEPGTCVALASVIAIVFGFAARRRNAGC